jgi:pimeloyl-ACP methyl ester carboxylesterase
MDTANVEPALPWASVQPAVAEFARACAFDRSGLGWSEPSPNTRTLSNYIQEQRTLLARAGVEPPYVLVGHSAGGLYVRVYAHQYPDEVAGIVLVDAAHEDLDVRPPESVTKMNKQGDPKLGGLEGQAAKRAAGLLPRGQMVKIPGAGHNVHQTQPEAILRVAEQLLASV